MVRDNRPKRKAKDDETSNSNNKGNSYNGVSSASGLPSSNTSGLRRSTRERQSKKQTSASPLSTRKSERLEQRTPTSIRVEKQVERSDNTLSPLTRSGRARSFLSSTPSSLNKTDKSSSSSDRKHRKKINGKGVTKFEDKSATQRAGVVKKRNLDARSCRIPFKSPKKVETSDSVKRRKLRENSPSGICSSDCSGSGKGLDGHEDDMPLTKFVYMRKGKNAVSSPGSKDSDKSNREKSKEANIILAKDGDVKQRILDDSSPSDFCSSKKSCGNPREPKRKINIMQVVSSANASSSPPSEPGMNYSVEVTTSCSKRQRVDDTNKNKVFSSHITLSKKLPHDAVVRDENENEESSRKRKKMGYSNGDSSSLKVAPDSKEAEEAVSVKEGGTNALLSHQFGENDLHIMHTHSKDNSTALEVQVAGSEEKRKSDDARSNLYQFLKPKISLLCKTVQLPGNVRNLAERFLNFVIANHRVSQESESALQAFQICVCWCAASLLDHKIDHNKSLELAKRELKFSCKENEAGILFSKMQLPKKRFLFREFKECKYRKDHPSEASGHARERLDGNNVMAADMVDGNPSEMVERGSAVSKPVDEKLSPPIEMAEMTIKQISKIIKKAATKCETQMEKLTERHLNEFEQFKRNWEIKKTSLIKEQRVQSTVIFSVHTNIPVRMERLKLLSSEYDKKLKELDHEMAISHKALEARQQDEKAEEDLKAAHFLEQVKSCAWDFGDEDNLSPPVEQIREHGGSNNSALTSGKLREDHNLDRVPNNGPDHEVTSFRCTRMSKVTCAADKVINNTLNDTLANIQAEKLPTTSTKSTVGDVSDGGPSPVLTTDESVICRSVEVVPLMSSIALKESTRPINSSQMPPIVESDCDSDHIDASASDRNISHLTSQNVGARQSVCREPTDEQLFPIKSHLVPVAGQGDLLDFIQSHGDEPCEAHGKEMHDPTEGDAEKTSSMLPTEASSSGHTVVLPSDRLGDDVQANLPVARVSESASTTPLGHEQSVLPVSQNQLCWEPRLENQSCPNILSIDYSQPSIAFPVHPAGIPNGVRSGLNSVARGAAFSECSHSSTAVAASVISPLSYPLHNELGRLRKETDEATRIHKETALQLKSDREKEIDQIRMKYETKIQETDALYALKKQQLDTKYKKVLMNMILAEAFRSNCDDSEAYEAAPGVQDLPPSRMQQVFQSEQPAFRPSAFDSATSNDQLTVSQQNPEISVRNNNYSSTFSSIPCRPPQIGPSIPAAINQQMRSCAPAPHLQYFRLPMPASSGGLSSVEFGPLNRQSVSSPFGSSHLIRELLTRPQQASARPPYQSSSRGWSHQPASVRASQACQNPLHSAMESLMGVSTRGGASQLSTLPPLSELTRNYRTWDLSEFGTPANNILPSSSDQAAIPANVRPFHQGVAGEVVCLSDDD